jgi:hypothetical protein
MRLGRWAVLALGIAAAACASTIGPVVPSVQVLVVLDSLDDTLRIIPVDTPDVVHKVLLQYDHSVALFNKRALAVSGEIGAASHGGFVFSFNVVSGSKSCDMYFSNGPTITSLAFGDDGHVYVVDSTNNSIQNFIPQSPCGIGLGYVRGGPRAFVTARGTQFIVTGNDSGFPSWLATSTDESSDPTKPLSPLDSISLSAPGNAQGEVLGSDGFLYVIDAGLGSPNARLSQVNPVARTELAVIPGFGTLPRFIATDGVDHIYVASAREGLMVYNIRTNRVERDANAPIQIFGSAPRGLVTDDLGRIYALTAGSCGVNPKTQGMIQVFGADLVNTKLVPMGTCPVAIAVTNISSTHYFFHDN